MKELIDSTFGKSMRSFINMILPQGLRVQLISEGNTFDYNLKQIANHSSASYALDYLGDAVYFEEASDYFDYCLSIARNRLLSVDSLCVDALFEFGVWKGRSINLIGRKMLNSAAHVYGFDSFEGLSENWGGTSVPKRFFDLGGKIR